MELLIIRHGESEADILKVMEGRADFPLTERGNNQAHQMARWVAARYHIDAIVASPLLRAKQTAGYLQKATGAPLQYDDDLMEWNNGLLAGLSRREAAEKYPEPAEKYPHVALYGTESTIAFRARAETALSKVLHGFEEDAVVAVVSHGGLIRNLYRAFLGLPLESDITFPTGDTGIHCWHIRDGKRSIIYANSNQHLHDKEGKNA